MVEPLEYKPIIKKLLDKTRAGRVPWEESDRDEFRCGLLGYGDEKYTVYVRSRQDGYALRIEDLGQRTVSYVVAEEEIVYRDAERKETFDTLSDLYELARRKALSVPEKLASVAELLDRL
jgi:hypothetical protein